MSLSDILAKKQEVQIDTLTKHYEEKKKRLNTLLEQTQEVSQDLIKLQKELNSAIDIQLNVVKQGGNPFK